MYGFLDHTLYRNQMKIDKPATLHFEPLDLYFSKTF